MGLELKVQPYQMPEAVNFNYDELKTALLERAKHYAAIVYTDEQIKDAKADRAALNKLKKTLNDERIKLEREYMTSFNGFKAQINEIIGIIDEPCKVIDEQVKKFEEAKKAEKREEIKTYFAELLPNDRVPDWLTLEKIFDESWLNASVSMKTVQVDIDRRLEQIRNDLAVIAGLPSYRFEAEQVYKDTLALSAAVSESHRLSEMAKQKAEWEARQAEAEKPVEQSAPVEVPPPTLDQTATAEPKKTWVTFDALLTYDDALALKDFFASRGIEYRRTK